mmetsp:Transcript_119606/g.338559  ORF Transcript_119606/g.338559 Transcript_119606/m.338559 type:complete len:317 (+) Transcript_119606:93-1043(+)
MQFIRDSFEDLRRFTEFRGFCSSADAWNCTSRACDQHNKVSSSVPRPRRFQAENPQDGGSFLEHFHLRPTVVDLGEIQFPAQSVQRQACRSPAARSSSAAPRNQTFRSGHPQNAYVGADFADYAAKDLFARAHDDQNSIGGSAPSGGGGNHKFRPVAVAAPDVGEGGPCPNRKGYPPSLDQEPLHHTTVNRAEGCILATLRQAGLNPSSDTCGGSSPSDALNVAARGGESQNKGVLAAGGAVTSDQVLRGSTAGAAAPLLVGAASIAMPTAASSDVGALAQTLELNRVNGATPANAAAAGRARSTPANSERRRPEL